MLAGMGGALVGPLLLGALGSDGVGPSQLLVMGPHHSATSITAASLRLLGLYLGEERDLLVDRSNPLKFWERRDVVEMNRQRLREGAGVSHLASSDSVPSFVSLGFDSSSAAQKRLNGKRQDVIAQLNAHRPWATKDPRLSLLAHEWLPLLDANAVCVLTVPALLLSSLQSQSHCIASLHLASSPTCQQLTKACLSRFMASHSLPSIPSSPPYQPATNSLSAHLPVCLR